jgi:hypothetical protein
MTTETMFHVTDASNVDSILEDGLQPQRDGGLVFFMDNEDDAREYGEIMPTVEDPVVFEAEVMEHTLRPDSEEPGNYPAYEKTGGVAPHDVELV